MNTKAPFESVVAQHGAAVLRVCRALLGRADADDAWSETFIAALRGYPGLPAGANVQAWLVTIAHRRCVDVIRSRLRTVPVATVPDSPAAPGNDGWVWAEVAALPPRQRQAIAYHYLGGLPFAEVAEIIGGSTDAARRASADGMKTLRAKLGAVPPAMRKPAARDARPCDLTVNSPAANKDPSAQKGTTQ